MELIRNLFHRSRQEPEEQGPLYTPVREAISSVQAYARSHGGEIELVGVSDEGDVTIRLRGACRGCPMSAVTLKHGIEEQLRHLVPGVGDIHQVA
jgi:Fe-S cluster biogenesis protein NfuA